MGSNPLVGGVTVGSDVGSEVGIDVGDDVGTDVGYDVGDDVGDVVGLANDVIQLLEPVRNEFIDVVLNDLSLLPLDPNIIEFESLTCLAPLVQCKNGEYRINATTAFSMLQTIQEIQWIQSSTNTYQHYVQFHVQLNYFVHFHCQYM